MTKKLQKILVTDQVGPCFDKLRTYGDEEASLYVKTQALRDQLKSKKLKNAFDNWMKAKKQLHVLKRISDI